VIELVGDVGAGKTTFAQGLSGGLGFSGEVPSPTFTVGRVYPANDGRQIHHFDFYRLGGRDVATDQLAEAIADPGAIVVVEWAGQGAAELPPDRLRITLQHRANSDGREIRVESLGAPSQYLTQGLQHAYRHSD